MSKAPQGTTYRDRVMGLAKLPRERIKRAPKNWRTHNDKQRGALRGLLSDIGIAGTELVWIPSDHARAQLRAAASFEAWLSTYDGPVQLIDGHLRHETLLQLQPVIVTDLDESEAALLLATFDPVSALAGRDDSLLAELLDLAKPRAKGAVELIEELRAIVKPPPPPDFQPGTEEEQGQLDKVKQIKCPSCGHEFARG